MNVLVVDDEATVRRIVRHVLSGQGYTVSEACNGREALDILRAGGTQVVICDREMPVMNGLSLCEEIRKGEYQGYIYVIMLTSHDLPHETIQGLEAVQTTMLPSPSIRASLSCESIRRGESYTWRRAAWLCSRWQS